MGRPPTGHQPRLSVRMDPKALRLAGELAKADGKTVGRWLEEAIREKGERERNHGSTLTQGHCQGTGHIPGILILHGQRQTSVAQGFVPEYVGVVNTFVTSRGERGAVFTRDLDSTTWARSAQHLHGVQGAPSSNPGAPTKTRNLAGIVAEDHQLGGLFL